MHAVMHTMHAKCETPERLRVYHSTPLQIGRRHVHQHITTGQPPHTVKCASCTPYFVPTLGTMPHALATLQTATGKLEG